ncbi:hypothetical protein [Actinoplanes sp. URMC 104]|uniref:hypothetical protein n=1 Tax=Actinoplanes sp. URMC 104 TaxID=3423409 RepID=UPI003F1B08EC
MTPDEHRARAEEILNRAGGLYTAVERHEVDDGAREAILAEIRAIGSLAQAHATLAVHPAAGGSGPRQAHRPTSDDVALPTGRLGGRGTYQPPADRDGFRMTLPPDDDDTLPYSAGD